MTLSTPNARNHETGAVERATRDLPNEVFYTRPVLLVRSSIHSPIERRWSQRAMRRRRLPAAAMNSLTALSNCSSTSILSFDYTHPEIEDKAESASTIISESPPTSCTRTGQLPR